MNEYKDKILKVCNESSKNTLMQTLDIEYVDIGENFLVGKMPVTPKVHQPDGVLHGGAMVALAESVGSMASYIFMDAQKVFCSWNRNICQPYKEYERGRGVRKGNRIT